jgi:hypothetical protein
MKPCLVWSILKMYNMPQLYCFHEEKATTHPMEHGLLYVVKCSQKKGKCGYYGKDTIFEVAQQADNAFPVNFNLTHQNKDRPTKLYQPNASVDTKSIEAISSKLVSLIT